MPPLGPRRQPKRRRPTAQELRSARVQARQYASQGRAVERQAERQKTVRKIVTTWGRKAPAPRGTRVELRATPKLAPTYRAAIRQGPSPQARQKTREQATARVRARGQERQYRSQQTALRRVRAKQRSQDVEVRSALKRFAREAPAPKGTTVKPSPRLTSSYQPRLTEREKTDTMTRALAQASPKTRAMLATNPKRRQQLASLFPAHGISGALKLIETRKATSEAKNLAPALKVLEQVSRPVHATAGGARAAIKGENVPRAVSRGARLKDNYLFSDVLKAAGVKNKTALGVGGFALDVALDPLTYVTFGTGTVAKQALAKTAREAAEAAARTTQRDLAQKVASKEITKKEAKQQARVKAKEIERKVIARGAEQAEQGPKGITVKVAGGARARRLATRVRGRAQAQVEESRNLGLVAGKRRPTTTTKRAATRRPQANAPVKQGEEAALGRKRFVAAPLIRATAAPKQIARKLGVREAETMKDLRAAGRNLGSELHGGIRPANLSKRQELQAKGLRRETRAQGERLARDVSARANSLLGRLAEHERQQVIDAIESGKIGSLKGQAQPLKASVTRPGTALRSRATRQDPDRLFLVARQVRSDLRYLQRVGRRSGLIGGQIGKGSRTLEEARLGARAGTTARSAKKLEPALKLARKENLDARAALRAAKTAPQKRSAQAAVERTSMRLRNLSGRQRGLLSQQASSQQAKAELRGIRSERLGREGQGYYSRGGQVAPDQRSFIKKLAKGPDSGVPRVEQLGANKPIVGAGKQREKFRKTRAELRKGTPEEQAYEKSLGTDVREELARYGTSIARGSAARNLNTRLVQEAGERLPKNLDFQKLNDLKEKGFGVYRVHRGELGEVTDAGHAIAAAQGKAQGQYAVISDDLVKRVRGQEAGQSGHAGQAVDVLQSKWKSLALATPGYLVRNVLGDAFNAAVHENPFTLARNVVKGQKALHELGRYEKAQRIFEKATPQSKRTIKLTPDQAAALGTTKREIPAMQAALLAEKHGVIRQGRFLELIEEGAKRPRGSHAWQNAVKRVEDSVRMTTFMGGLHRGLSPSEASAQATKIHFDYGDLTTVEKRVLRRVMPFYTFSSRNIPLQAKALVQRPGRYAAVAKAREEGRRSTGLEEGYESGENPYEARQLGIPMKFGGKTYTVSAASPFTDLNDLTAAAGGPKAATETGVKRMGEMLSPFIKTAPELTYNLSLFYRDQIEPDKEPLTRAPAWATKAAKEIPGFAKQVGFTDSYAPPEGGGKQPGWNRSADYFFRQGMPGPIAPLLDLADLGVKGANARQMTKAQRLLAASGVRAIEYKQNQAEINRTYARLDKIDGRLNRLRRLYHPTVPGVRINADNPTPEFTRLFEEQKKLNADLDARKRTERPEGFVAGEPVRAVGQALAPRGGPVRRTGAVGRSAPIRRTGAVRRSAPVRR